MQRGRGRRLIPIDEENRNQLVKFFEDSLKETISTSSGLCVKKSQSLCVGGDCFAGVLPFYGDVNGFFIIKAQNNTLRVLTSYITGIAENKIEPDDLKDCIGEIANMVCGLVRARAAVKGISFSFSTPLCAMSTDDVLFSFKENVIVFSFGVANEEIVLRAEVALR